jgi:hypothetical protein
MIIGMIGIIDPARRRIGGVEVQGSDLAMIGGKLADLDPRVLGQLLFCSARLSSSLRALSIAAGMAAKSTSPIASSCCLRIRS